MVVSAPPNTHTAPHQMPPTLNCTLGVIPTPGLGKAKGRHVLQSSSCSLCFWAPCPSPAPAPGSQARRSPGRRSNTRHPVHTYRLVHTHMHTHSLTHTVTHTHQVLTEAHSGSHILLSHTQVLTLVFLLTHLHCTLAHTHVVLGTRALPPHPPSAPSPATPALPLQLEPLCRGREGLPLETHPFPHHVKNADLVFLCKETVFNGLSDDGCAALRPTAPPPSRIHHTLHAFC